MPQRVIKIILPENYGKQALALLEHQDNLVFWLEESSCGNFVASALSDSGRSETIMDLFERKFSSVEDFKLILFPIEASIPRSDAEDVDVLASPRDKTNIILAFASGCAGVPAFTTGASSAVIGVMVAVALLPPLAVCCLLLGTGQFAKATGSFLFFITNKICINLAGVITFLFQGSVPEPGGRLTGLRRQPVKRWYYGPSF